MATHDDDFLAQLFVANTHTPVLFFSSEGRVYKLKVYRLPLGTPQARGKAMINLFRQLADGRIDHRRAAAARGREHLRPTSASCSPPSSGKIRRNALADFIFVPANGKIAMGLDEGDHLVGSRSRPSGTTCCSRRAAASACAFRSAACACSARAPPRACAAWIWPRVTG